MSVLSEKMLQFYINQSIYTHLGTIFNQFIILNTNINGRKYVRLLRFFRIRKGLNLAAVQISTDLTNVFPIFQNSHYRQVRSFLKIYIFAQNSELRDRFIGKLFFV